MAIVYDGGGLCNRAINIRMARKFRGVAEGGAEAGLVMRQARALNDEIRADH